MSDVHERVSRLREHHGRHRCQEDPHPCQSCTDMARELEEIEVLVLELLARVPPAPDTTPASITLRAH